MLIINKMTSILVKQVIVQALCTPDCEPADNDTQEPYSIDLLRYDFLWQSPYKKVVKYIVYFSVSVLKCDRITPWYQEYGTSDKSLPWGDTCGGLNSKPVKHM